MKILLFLATIALTINFQTDVTQMREDFHDISTHDEVKEFIQKYEQNPPQSEPYVASAIMRRAEFVFLPTTKLKYFNQRKNKLEKFIKNNPQNIEGRYVRILVQRNIPAFLGYSDNIEKDRKIIRQNIETSTLPKDYKQLILKNIQ